MGAIEHVGDGETAWPVPRPCPAMAADDVAAVLGGLQVASFRWDARTDRMSWSDNAAAVLGLVQTPPTGRALQRLLARDGATARAAAVPSVGVPGPAGAATGYRVTYEIGAEPGVRPGRRVDEIGRWLCDAEGHAVGSEGILVPSTATQTPAPGGTTAVDAGTGLLLRDSLLHRLDEAIRAAAGDGRGSCAFLVIAIDGLATINASFGYDVGDRIITAVAQRIGRRMRQGDVLGHMSGHKFGALLHDCSESAVTIAAERFREAVGGELVVTEGAEIAARISIGAVVAPRHAADADTAAIRAEEALAEARDDVERGFAVYHPSPERDRARRRNIQAAEDIVHGLAENRFVLAYQPVVAANGREILSYEALARLVRPDGFVLSAGPLIATAERLGLIRRLDLRILELALADLAANPGLRLSVNASVETVTDPQWLARLVEAISATRSIAGRLTIEITETAAMRNVEEMTRIAAVLRDIGCRIAIDDFGSGHTSFKALRRMEVDWVKIDGSYVADITENEDSVVFVRTLATLAGHFGIRTVAEWVQDEKAAVLLADLGVEALQGRHVGEPRLRIPGNGAAAAIAERYRADVAGDGYPAFRDVLAGALAVGAPAI
ncbi:phytochrome-like protein cph2 [Pleomorphomonas sp. SM30]|uniref:Diguanylate cyclase/phosphodiesterase n=2 Tax=Oharaeibacter diazotrophicus TaxID=1920512 RepID=A0A4R6RD92_9HYPH|nr:diguanylate cyclase/phosphodiesterase [Oharaeibacter diazotrophicus]BBE73158.1 phytochrome-like protein cph2 [Pleomorphomonas sp. SM30]GLS74947.1 GGDEF-domain containing protein [Oharaeibacter diazotrophicus]